MKKTLFMALVGVLVVAGVLAGIKFLQIRKMTGEGSAAPPPTTVSVARAEPGSWPRLLTAVGSLEAAQGVTVTAELPGKVVAIDFEAGQGVAAGELLIQQDVSSEQARLPGAEAAATLARRELERARRLLADRVIPQSDFDTAEAAYRQATAAVADIRATIAKKTIRAPFAGRLGIRRVDPGQMLDAGAPVVSLQGLDPLEVHFFLPQKQLDQLRPGLKVRVAAAGSGTGPVEGTITALDSTVDPVTRNIELQATLPNPDGRLRPGMYAPVEVVLPEPREVLAIPATAVLYAPYGNSVFVVEPADAGGGTVVRQQFVHLGVRRGDFVAVTEGLEAGQTVVSTGAFRLRNGQQVRVDDSVEPTFKLEPQPEEG